jgi:hypothetical protein
MTRALPAKGFGSGGFEVELPSHFSSHSDGPLLDGGTGHEAVPAGQVPV